MKVKSKVAKYGERKIAEIPKAVRDNFKIGEDVTIEKSKQPSFPRRNNRKGTGG